MAAAFYSRYVPPAKGVNSSAVPAASTTSDSKKRKREVRHNDAAGDDQAANHLKKSRHEEAVPRPTKKNNHREETRQDVSSRQAAFRRRSSLSPSPQKEGQDRSPISRGQSTTQDEATTAAELLAKYSVTGKSKNHQKGRTSPIKKQVENAEDMNGPEEEVRERDDGTEQAHTQEKKRHKEKRRRPDPSSVEEPPDEHEASALQKHDRVRAKYEKSAKVKEAGLPSVGGDALMKPIASETVEQHGLEPLPQPPPAPESSEIPTYSSLPRWLANPVAVPPGEKVTFETLGVGSRMLQTLRGKGYERPFPIQSTVIPILLRRHDSPQRDVCISAATGSGKTLAYVLPMVEALQHNTTRKLRGIVVVPTRELVHQARELCQLCCDGTRLKVGTAVGSRPLREEQKTLIQRTQKYRPGMVHVNSNEGQTSTALDSFSLTDLLEDIEDDFQLRPDYVVEYQSEVDILICTPGRLVDHLRSTKGFSIAQTEWLVLDEADRLLNESFQEWINVVIPALEAETPYEQLPLREKLLLDMKFDRQPKRIQKVILSATMTNDLSKLNSLKLRNPELVIVGSEQHAIDGGEERIETDGDVKVNGEGGIELPTSLRELTVSIKDEADKPLYLYELLRSHILEKRSGNDMDASDSDASSSDSSDSSDTSDGESSDEDSVQPSDASVDEETHALPHGPPKLSKAKNNVLIFTKSTESASRLSRLISLLDPAYSSVTGSLTKSSASSSSRRTLSLFRQGKLSILVATDRASRGLDIPELAHVVSYDMPASVTSYVHRVGRTARAAREGTAWTLVVHREGKWFWNEIGKGSGGSRIKRRGKVGRYTVRLQDDEELRARYASALSQLGDEVRRGK